MILSLSSRKIALKTIWSLGVKTDVPLGIIPILPASSRPIKV
jgi:hypothetical protein